MSFVVGEYAFADLYIMLVAAKAALVLIKCLRSFFMIWTSVSLITVFCREGFIKLIIPGMVFYRLDALLVKLSINSSYMKEGTLSEFAIVGGLRI